MDVVKTTLTVFFEKPFWVAVCEQECGGTYEVCKVTFGAEPKDYEIYHFILTNFDQLNFSPPIQATAVVEKRSSPKRMQREISKQVQDTGIGTKAQQALKLQQEGKKLEHKARTRERREMEKEQQFQLRQKKRKEKHKGH